MRHNVQLRAKPLIALWRIVVLNVVRYEKRCFVDYITLSLMLFSVNYSNTFEELSKKTMYDNVKDDGYNCEDYLYCLEVENCDYRKLYEQYKVRKDVNFIIDPPYLSSEAGMYKSYWKLADYLDVFCRLQRVFLAFTSLLTNRCLLSFSIV